MGSFFFEFLIFHFLLLHMRSTRYLLFYFTILFAGLSYGQTNYYPSVLVELFSSEGCSSCIIADEFLKKIIDISDSTQSPVYCLDYHVDIWNRSGWVDRFSDTSFSRRQREYMIKTNQASLFTPMVFVNGSGALPGGAKKEIGQALNKALKTKPKAQLMIKAGYIPNQHLLTIRYEIEGSVDSASLNLVIAFKTNTTQVTGGENIGKTLIHHHTAATWNRFEIHPSQKGTVELKVPDGIAIADLLLIGFVQHEPTWEIVASDQLIFH